MRLSTSRTCRFRLALASVAVAGLIAAQSSAKFPGWGEPTDPGKDSEISADGKALVMSLPATPAQDMRAETGKRTAPRVMRDIEGNHIATMRVSGTFEPGQTAGFLLQLDDRNFLRFARSAPDEPVVLEYWRSGQLQPIEASLPKSGGAGEAVWLRYTRRLDRFKAELSTDAQNWTEVASISIRLSSRLSLGAVATNTAGKPLTVRFEDLTIKGLPLNAPAP
jgi:regulation of enolase protein 1 (concanavalin A-like superfamily)